MSVFESIKKHYPKENDDISDATSTKIMDGVLGAMSNGASPVVVVEELAFHFISSAYALCHNHDIPESEADDIVLEILERAKNKIWILRLV